MTDKILYHQQPNGVGILTFSRPSAKNALDLEAMRAFMGHIHRLQSDTSVRVLIITGAGRDAFCSGGDLVELSQHTSQDDARHFTGIMSDALLALERLHAPVIAAINGYALGGGSEIAVACDMRFVDEAVRLGFVQVKMALTPGWGAGQRLLRIIGYARAMELLLSGKILTAQDVLTLGLANGISTQGEALNKALEFADTISQHDFDVIMGVSIPMPKGKWL